MSLAEADDSAVENEIIQNVVRQAEVYGPETRNRLESRLREQRLEEVRAANIMLEEEAKEQRLELKLWKQKTWRDNYVEVQDIRLVKSCSRRRWSGQPICTISPTWWRWSGHLW